MSHEPTDNPIAQRIFQAAIRLFSHKGYAAASTREIVEAAGVTKPMLYYYFQSKEGLCRALLRHYLDPFHQRLREAVEAPAEPREMLVAVVWTHLQTCQQNRDFTRLFYALYFGPGEQATELDLDTYLLPGRELMARAAQLAAQNGLVAPQHTDRLRMGLSGMINIWVLAALKEQAELHHALAVSIVDGLLDGLAPMPQVVSSSAERTTPC